MSFTCDNFLQNQWSLVIHQRQDLPLQRHFLRKVIPLILGSNNRQSKTCNAYHEHFYKVLVEISAGYTHMVNILQWRSQQCRLPYRSNVLFSAHEGVGWGNWLCNKHWTRVNLGFLLFPLWLWRVHHLHNSKNQAFQFAQTDWHWSPTQFQWFLNSGSYFYKIHDTRLMFILANSWY